MIELDAVISILIAHFLADFVAQSSKVATGKSKNIELLALHVSTYGVVFVVTILIANILLMSFRGAAFLAGKEHVTLWIISNVFLHFMVDFFTSKVNSNLYRRDDKHMFFVGIGFDQLIHYLFLFTTYAAFVY